MCVGGVGESGRKLLVALMVRAQIADCTYVHIQ